MTRETYDSFGDSYNSGSGTDLLDDPRTDRSSTLGNDFLENVDSVVTRDRTLARDYTQNSGE